MKKIIFTIFFISSLLLTGCEDKPKTLNEEPSTTTSTTTTSSTTESTTTSITTKDSTTTSSKKTERTTTTKTTTSSTTGRPTTSTKTTTKTTIKKVAKAWFDKNNNVLVGFMECDDYNNCKCYLKDGTPQECYPED